MVRQFQVLIDAIEADRDVRVVVFDSAVEGFFLNHSDFKAKLEDILSLPAGPTGLPPWPDFLVRLTRAPVVSIALIRGRATGNGSEILLACDMGFGWVGSLHCRDGPLSGPELHQGSYRSRFPGVWRCRESMEQGAAI